MRSSLISFSRMVVAAYAQTPCGAEIGSRSRLRARRFFLHRRLLAMALFPLTMQGQWATFPLITCMQVNARKYYRKREDVVIFNVRLIGCLIKRPIDEDY